MIPLVLAIGDHDKIGYIQHAVSALQIFDCARVHVFYTNITHDS